MHPFLLSCQEESFALFGDASTPVLVLRRVAPAPGLVRRVAPAPGLVNPALLPAATLRSLRRYFQFFALQRCPQFFCLVPPNSISYIKTTLSQGPRLEDRRPSRRPSRNPLPLNSCARSPSGRSCVRSLPVLSVGSLLRPVSSIQLSFRR